MKKTLTMCCAIAFLLTALQLPAQVGINSDNSSPDQSAGLEVKFNNKGFLPPRLTQAQIRSIPNPANGLIVFCTTDNKCYVYISTAVAWKELLFGTATISPLSCGNQFTDTRDGKIYNTVLIGDQCWMAQNLNIGTKITGSVVQTNNGTIEKWCHNDNDPSCAIYGGLYQWDELMNYTTASNSNPSGRQGICPSGWHVPSDAEWCQLETYLDPTVICTDWNERGTDAGGKLKETGTSHWTSPNTGATNSSGFTALPGGFRASSGPFQMINNGTYIWTSSESGSNRLLRILYYSYSQIARGMNPILTGSSCRCVKD